VHTIPDRRPPRVRSVADRRRHSRAGWIKERWLLMVRSTASPAFLIASADDIAERAYQFYVDRGRADGHDREDWLRAERELHAAPTIAAVKGAGHISSKTKLRPE
jgi:hypothetical protein